jgi:hypothetical protein
MTGGKTFQVKGFSEHKNSVKLESFLEILGSCFTAYLFYCCTFGALEFFFKEAQIEWWF